MCIRDRINTVQVTLLDQGAVQEVHLGAADEACNEHIAGHIVQVLRGIDLLDDAVFHNNDEMCIRDRDTSYAEEDYAIGLAKGSALEDAVNAPLEELKADGTLQSIVDKDITAE